MSRQFLKLGRSLTPGQLCRRHHVQILKLVAVSLMLAALTAAYGAMAGPLLRSLFGGGHLSWPSSVSHLLPPPPSVDTLRANIAWLIVLVAFLKALAQYRHTVLSIELEESVCSELRGHVHGHVVQLAPDIIAGLGVSEITSRLGHDVDAVSKAVSLGVVGGLRDVFQVLALIAVCALIDWKMALLVFGVYPFAFWPIIRIGKRLRGASETAHAQRARLMTKIHDHMRRLALFQLSGANQSVKMDFAQENQEKARASMRAGRVWALSSPITEILGALALVAGIVYTISRVDADDLAPELVISFLAALLMLYQPAKNLSRLQGIIEPGRAALGRVKALLAYSDFCPDSKGKSPPAAAPKISFQGVSFERSDGFALKHICWSIPSGSLCAMVGPNGSGKTTSAWLVARMLEPSEGCVLVDGVDLRKIDTHRWRRQIGWVTQGAMLGIGTIRENVTLGLTDVSQTRLDELAEQLGLYELIHNRLHGWDHKIGEEGHGFSGGEQQRLALLRALIRAPTVLILDEPTAHLDERATLQFMDLLSRMKVTCTIILITHDPKVARLCDLSIHMGSKSTPNATGLNA